MNKPPHSTSPAVKLNLFSLTLPPGASRADRRRFFGRVTRAMAIRHCSMTHWGGMCVVISLDHPAPSDCCRLIFDVLLDFRRDMKVVMYPSIEVRRFQAGEFQLVDEKGDALPRQIDVKPRPLLQRLLQGAVLQGLQRPRGEGKLSKAEG
jgi:hypothetical protein